MALPLPLSEGPFVGFTVAIIVIVLCCSWYHAVLALLAGLVIAEGMMLTAEQFWRSRTVFFIFNSLVMILGFEFMKANYRWQQRMKDDLVRKDHKIVHLLRDLTHRVKNQYAIVTAMMRQTDGEDIDEYKEKMIKRIQGLARSQDLLIDKNWKTPGIKDVIMAHLKPFGSCSRFDIKCETDIYVNAAAVQYIGMALHELATNAVKYGALSAPDGKVELCWKTEGDAFVFEWKERDGPPVNSINLSGGFGSIAINTYCPTALNGNSELRFDRDGVRWRLDVPLTSVSVQPTAA